MSCLNSLIKIGVATAEVEVDAEIMAVAVVGIAATVTQAAMEVEVHPTEAVGVMDGAEVLLVPIFRADRAVEGT